MDLFLIRYLYYIDTRYKRSQRAVHLVSALQAYEMLIQELCVKSCRQKPSDYGFDSTSHRDRRFARNGLNPTHPPEYAFSPRKLISTKYT